MKDGEFKELAKAAAIDKEKALNKARVNDIIHNKQASGKTHEISPGIAALDKDITHGNAAPQQKPNANTQAASSEKTEDKGEDAGYSYGMGQ